MMRFLSEGLFLFLLPFAVYAGFLAVRSRMPAVGPAWSNVTLGWLAGSGLILAILGMVLLGLVSPRHQGAYRPAHIENGRLIPGQMD